MHCLMNEGGAEYVDPVNVVTKALIECGRAHPFRATSAIDDGPVKGHADDWTKIFEVSWWPHPWSEEWTDIAATSAALDALLAGILHQVCIREAIAGGPLPRLPE